MPTRRIHLKTLLACAALLYASASVFAQDAALLSELAPTGRLRAAINFGNTVLVQKDPGGGAPQGVAADLARELARRTGLPLDYVAYDSAGAAVEALKQQQWDIGFLAIDPKRAEDIIFSPPYVIIEGSYLVSAASPLQRVEDVDQPGNRIAVGKGSAYALYLQRTLKHAKLIEAPTSPDAVELFQTQKLEAAAGVHQPLEAYAKSNTAVHLLPGHFMTINQAMTVPKGRGRAAVYVKDFIEEMKASGFVERALKASGQGDVGVAR